MAASVEYRFSTSLSRRDNSFAFLQSIDAVDGGNRDLFFCAASPVNLHPVHFRCRSETEVQTLIGTRSIASAAEDVPALSCASCRDKYFGSNRITGALGASQQLYRDPVVRILDRVTQQCGRRIDVVQDHVDMTVVEQVAERRASCRYNNCEAASCCRRHFLEFRSIQIAQ